MGMFLIGAAPLLILVMGLAAGMDMFADDGMFFLIMAAVPLVLGVLILRFGTWSKALGILGTVAAAMSMFWLAFGLMAPTSFGDFVPAVMFVAGFLMSLGGNIAAIVRRRELEDHAARGERRVMVAAFTAVALAIVISGVGNLVSKTSVSAEAAAGSVNATMAEMKYSEASLSVAAGDPAKILVHNSDPFVHDFAIPALDIAPVMVGPGSSELVEVNAPAGEYTVYCTLHSDTDEKDPAKAGMATKLVAK